MPQKFEKAPYSFATIPLGTAFLAYGLGGILGKWSGGLVGDKTCSWSENMAIDNLNIVFGPSYVFHVHR